METPKDIEHQHTVVTRVRVISSTSSAHAISPPSSAPLPPESALSPTASAPKLSGAELKKQKQAEKAARRAQAIKGKTIAHPPPPPPPTSASTPAADALTEVHTKAAWVPHAINLPGAMDKKLPIREKIEPKKEDKTVEFFRHLYKPRTTTIAGVSKEVHPAVLSLGFQMSNYTICGSCARLVATLQAFKRVIESYSTPPMNSLTRHLTSHVLSPQIEYLASCRPLSISMGNAIRWLKLEISKVDPSTSDAEAKKGLCEAIDVFIRERVTFADKVIAESAAERIKDGDVIMTFAKSSIVQRALVQAHEEGKKFRVIVVDSRPLHEGKNLATSLFELGLQVKYCLISGVSHNIQDVNKVFLGAHAMMSNGRLFSRVGTALVAMEAFESDKPVIVLCETIKFTERVTLDSIVHNEIAPANELIIAGGPLENWGDVKRLQLCNPMFDVTPAEYIHMIVTESGNVPPTSVPVLHRLGNENH